MKTVIVDIDGTLANNSHRSEYLTCNPKNWPAYKAGIMLDTLHEDILEIVDMYREKGYKIVLCSGRGEDERAKTEEWLMKHSVNYDSLYMRADKDYRSDDIIKLELLAKILKDGYEPFIVFDDRDRVVKAWRSVGLRCVQVREGNF